MGPFLVVATGAAVGAMTALILAIHGPTDEGVRLALHWTARASFVLFLATFLASSVNRLAKGSRIGRWLMRERTWLGLSFALSHTIHLGLIATLMTEHSEGFWNERTVTSIVPGMVAYVFIALMAVTSWRGAVRRLGRRRWNLLHKTGIYVVALVFLAAYVKQAQAAPVYYAFAAVLLAAFGVRYAASRTRNVRPRASTPRPRAQTSPG